MTSWRTGWRKWLVIFGVWMVVSIAADLLFGGMVHFVDVSNDPRFAELVGRQFASTTEGRIYGITNDPNYRPPVDEYVITPLPGIGGPDGFERRIRLARNRSRPKPLEGRRRSRFGSQRR